MDKPNFQILSDTKLYSNALTPVKVSAEPSTTFSSNYYIWDFGDGTKKNGESAEHVYTEVGDFEITLTQFLPTGDPRVSDSKKVNVSNLIPNLMNWDKDSFDSISVVASVKNQTPFIANVYNSWQQYDENSFLHLYVENSKSIPFDISDKRIHLKPNWRFLDADDNTIETIKLNQQKIYGYKVDDEIYLSTNEIPNSVFVGVSSQAEFFFVDDTPSGVDPTQNYLPSSIIVTQNLSSIYGDKKFTSEDYLQYPSLIKSVFVDNIVPEKLLITSNGVFEMDGIKFINTKIPYNIRLVDSNNNLIKTHPVDSNFVNPYELEIGFSEPVSLETGSIVTGTLERFKTDFSNLGGFFDGYFIPLNDSTESITLTASTKIDYTINRTLSRFGVFSDENSDNLYRVSYNQDLFRNYIRKESETDTQVIDKNRSNKFSTIVDSKYNTVFLDSDKSNIEIYDIDFNLLSSIDLSFYDEYILSSDPLSSPRGHPSPSQIQMDKEGNYFITLHETADLIYVINNQPNKIDLYPQLDSKTVVFNDNLVIFENELSISNFVYYEQGDDKHEFVFQPNAIDILSDDKHIYVSYTRNENLNFIQKYHLNRDTTFTLDSLGIFNFGTKVPVDMISNRNGSRLFVLLTDYYSRESYVKIFNTSTDQEISEIFVGYDSEFITLDLNQRAWVLAKTDKLNNFYDVLTKIRQPSTFNYYIINKDESRSYSEFSSYIDNDSFPNTFIDEVDDIIHLGGIAGDSYGNIWLLDSLQNKMYIVNSDTFSYTDIVFTEDESNINTKYVAYGDWNGFRWFNKFGFGDLEESEPQIITYELYGESKPFKIYPRNYYNLQKINEIFDATETLKSYRTTESMLNYDNLFDNFLGSIYGNKLSDESTIGKSMYEKIANFVMNNADIETCSIDALKSFCEEVGVEFEDSPSFPAELKRLINIFSIKFKKLWGDDFNKEFDSSNLLEKIGGYPKIVDDRVVYNSDGYNFEYVINENLNVVYPVLKYDYDVSANPQIKILAVEKFNNATTVISPLIVNGMNSYPLSSYDSSWGWGLSVPEGQPIHKYYDFYELTEVDKDRLNGVIDWGNDLTTSNIKPLSSFSNYMKKDGIVSYALGEKIRDGLGLFYK